MNRKEHLQVVLIVVACAALALLTMLSGLLRWPLTVQCVLMVLLVVVPLGSDRVVRRARRH